jgi:hypothetical protein
MINYNSRTKLKILKTFIIELMTKKKIRIEINKSKDKRIKMHLLWTRDRK